MITGIHAIPAGAAPGADGAFLRQARPVSSTQDYPAG